MTRHKFSRRAALLTGAAMLAAGVLPAVAQATGPAIHVLKDPSCGCCTAWIEIVAAEGFVVTTELADAEALMRFKMENGIPEAMTSCHTAQVEGYLIEGHVPVADIRRLLDQRPKAVGLAVPGMPWGSPGMGPESEREAYDVHLIHRDGSTTVFSSYAAA